VTWVRMWQGRLAGWAVRLAAWLAPAPARPRFVAEWSAELWHEARLEDGLSPIGSVIGAFNDALELRRLNLRLGPGARRRSFMEGVSAWVRDAKLAMRSLVKSPMYTLVATLTLALGIGGTASVYTLLDRVVLDPLPYPDAHTLVRLTNLVPRVDPGAVWHLSEAQYFYFTEHARTLESLGVFTLGGVNIETPSGARRAQVANVSAGLLPLLGVRVQRGRSIDSSDDQVGAPNVALLSDGFWRREFGADPAILGRTISVNATPVEVIGVLDPGVMLPQPGIAIDEGPELWMTLKLDPAGPFYSHHYLSAVARVGPGIEPEQVTTEVAQLTQRFPNVFPQAYGQNWFDQYGFRTITTPLKAYVVQDVASAIWILMGAVALILVIAGANVVNLFLVRMEARRKELAVRAALGAGTGALARPIVAESLVLCLTGGALGLLLGFWAVPTLVALAPDTLPRLETVGFRTGSVLFTAGLSLASGLFLSVLPVLQYLRARDHLRVVDDGRSSTAGRDRQRLRAALVVSQVALALTLVIGAGLLLASLNKLHAVDPGVRPDGVVTMRLHLAGERYQGTTDFWRFYSRVLDGLRDVPGVQDVGLSSTLPFGGGYGCTVQGFEDRAVYDRLDDAGLTTCAGQAPTTPGYFEAIGIPILRGRGLVKADLDDPSRGVVVVSQAFADRFWPGEDAIGKGVAPSGRTAGPFYRVVGVAGDVFSGSVTEEPAPAIYYPIVPIPESGGIWQSGMQLFVRTGLDAPESIVPSVRDAVAQIDPSIPISDAREMQAVIDESLSRFSFMAVLLQLAAGTALLLAAVGLYGVISYLVSRRTREIGMRIAIGARPAQVERQVVLKSMSLLAIGLVLGVIMSLGATRAMGNLLFGVEPTHPLTFVVAAGLLSAVAFVASWLPARRAARIDPLNALRVE